MTAAWDDESLRVKVDSALVTRYRRLQSWYRETHLGVPPGPSGKQLVGSAVPKGLHPGLNFVTPAAREHAEERIREVPEEKGTLDADRLRRNLLSSMPMCFNLFGALRGMGGFAELLAATLDPDANAVDGVTCEWAPPPAERLGDRSAFDAIIRYRTAGGTERFVGVETKYTEPFSPRHYANERYRMVTETSGWFAAGAFDALEKSHAKQLWRTVMLAAAYSETSGVDGRAAVVSLAEDVRANAAVALLHQHMTQPERLVHVSLEALVEAAQKSTDPEVVAWAANFADRYLDPDRVG